jgi:hypothetical protein
MSDFRSAQSKAHPNKTNALMSGIILMLILFVSIQIWFLFGALNNALEDNLFFAVITFVGSCLFALASFWMLRYLPQPIKEKPIKRQAERDKNATKI